MRLRVCFWKLHRSVPSLTKASHRCLWLHKPPAKMSKQKTKSPKFTVGLAKSSLINRGAVREDQTQHQGICLWWHSLRAMHKNCWLNWDQPWEHKWDFVWAEPEQGAVSPSGLRYNVSVCFDIKCANPPAGMDFSLLSRAHWFRWQSASRQWPKAGE